MSEIIEVVFENISSDMIPTLMRNLSHNGKQINDYSFQNERENFLVVDWNSIDSIKGALNKLGDGEIFINLNVLQIDSLELKKCGLQIMRCEDIFDVNILIPIEEIPICGLVQKLMAFSKTIAEKYRSSNYYSGLEPAIDKNTRIFTNEVKGPLVLNI